MIWLLALVLPFFHFLRVSGLECYHMNKKGIVKLVHCRGYCASISAMVNNNQVAEVNYCVPEKKCLAELQQRQLEDVGHVICRGLIDNAAPGTITQCKAAVCQSDGCNNYNFRSDTELNSCRIHQCMNATCYRPEESLTTVVPLITSTPDKNTVSLYSTYPTYPTYPSTHTRSRISTTYTKPPPRTPTKRPVRTTKRPVPTTPKRPTTRIVTLEVSDTTTPYSKVATKVATETTESDHTTESAIEPEVASTAEAEKQSTKGETEKPATQTKQPSTEAKQPTTEAKQPTTEAKQPTTEAKQPTTEAKQPTTEAKQPTTEAKQPTTEEKQPTTEVKQPITEEKQHITEVKKHITEAKQPITEPKQPTTRTGTPPTTTAESSGTFEENSGTAEKNAVVTADQISTTVKENPATPEKEGTLTTDPVSLESFETNTHGPTLHEYEAESTNPPSAPQLTTDRNEYASTDIDSTIKPTYLFPTTKTPDPEERTRTKEVTEPPTEKFTTKMESTSRFRETMRNNIETISRPIEVNVDFYKELEENTLEITVKKSADANSSSRYYLSLSLLILAACFVIL